MNKEKKNLILEKIVLLTREDVGEIFGYCKQTINEMFNDNEFPAITFGKKHLVELEALKKYISTRRG